MKTENKRLDEMQIKFDFHGWKSLLNIKSGTSRILILKSVVRGLELKKGTPIYSYLARDANERPIMVSYLDSRPRDVIKNPEDDDGR